jgi:hypothetical protein
MSSNAKFWIRVVFLAGVIAWPTVESYRLGVTTRKMTEAQALEQKVLAKLEVTRAKHAQMAKGVPTSAPASKPATTAATEIAKP